MPDEAEKIDPKIAAKILEEKAEKFLKEHPVAFIAAGVLLFKFLSSGREVPEFLKGLAPISPKTAGPWRGKGSFGKGFGPNKVAHK